MDHGVRVGRFPSVGLAVAIQVVTVPSPPVGTDWRYVIPGGWVANLLGVTATLSTPSGIATFADSSGGGHPATLVGPGTNLLGQPGPYGGGATNYGVRVPAASTASFNPAGAGPVVTLDLWEWFDGGVGGAGTFYMFFSMASGGSTLFPWGYYFGGLNPGHGWTNPQDLATIQGIFVTNVFTGFMPLLGWHHFAARTNGGGGDGHFDVFLDGTLIASNLTANGIGGGGIVNIGGGPFPPGKEAAVALYPAALSDAQIAAHYAARTTHDTYKAAVLADSPSGLWMLDELGAQFTKQVTLAVGDGTRTVATFPAGFVTVNTNAGTWSWQAAGAASVQSADGTVSTVAIPELNLPAGYSVGTRTLDLAATDQWSAITLWFDDGTGPGGGLGGGDVQYLDALLVPDYGGRTPTP